MKTLLSISLLFLCLNLYAQTREFGLNIFAPQNGVFFANQNAVLALQRAQDKADTHYKKGEYNHAFPMYMGLAEIGDKFSQYRVAIMYEYAQGVERDLIKSYAWSYAAAEQPTKPLRDYNIHVRDKLNPKQLTQAKQLASEYLSEYGIYAVSYNALKVIRKLKRRCTGSMVGNRCDRVTSNNINCTLNSEGLPDRSCLKLGVVGLPGVVGQLPADIRKAQKNLHMLMDKYDPGQVELGEFRLIDEEDEVDEE